MIVNLNDVPMVIIYEILKHNFKFNEPFFIFGEYEVAISGPYSMRTSTIEFLSEEEYNEIIMRFS